MLKGVVNYANGKYTIARDHFSKAIQSHPACSATVRVALASCCFKLEEYDRAKHVLESAIKLDVSCSRVCVGVAYIIYMLN